MNTIKTISLSLLVLCLVYSCKTEKDNYTLRDDQSYLNLKVGNFIVYQVDSTIYDPTADTLISNSSTFFKEEIVDTLHGITGNVLFKTERYERAGQNDQWRITKVFTQSIQGNQGIVNIDNLKFIKMGFPIQENASWDGLVNIDKNLIVTVAGESIQMFKDWDYRIESFDIPEQVGDFDFQEVLNLREADSENLIERRFSKEKYAKGVGLVFRERWILDTQCIEGCEGMSWEDKAEKGFIVRQTIIEHG